MKILSTGHPGYGIAAAIKKVFEQSEHTVHFASRSYNNMNLCDIEQIKKFAEMSIEYDAVINNSSLKNFSQTILFDKIISVWRICNKKGHIINIGSAADSSRNFDSTYSTEKNSLKKHSENHALNCIYKNSGIKVTYISFGWVSTHIVNTKFPNEKKHDATEIASLIKWVLDYPISTTNINEIRIEPIQ